MSRVDKIARAINPAAFAASIVFEGTNRAQEEARAAARRVVAFLASEKG